MKAMVQDGLLKDDGFLDISTADHWQQLMLDKGTLAPSHDTAKRQGRQETCAWPYVLDRISQAAGLSHGDYFLLYRGSQMRGWGLESVLGFESVYLGLESVHLGLESGYLGIESVCLGLESVLCLGLESVCLGLEGASLGLESVYLGLESV